MVTRVDGNIWQQSWFNPYVQWYYPFFAEFAGETVYQESDVPGYSNKKTHFSNLQYQSGNDDSFYNYGCNHYLNKVNDLAGVTRSDGTSWYNNMTSSCLPEFDIWEGPAGQ